MSSSYTLVPLMKLAAISDIHGNLPALEAVLGDIGRRGADLVVNLGDALSGPLLPAETADRLMDLGFPTIRGNHERQLLTLMPEEMNASDRYTNAQLLPKHREWIASLRPALLLEDVLLVHGTPESDLGYFLETVEESGVRAAAMAEVAERARSASASMILCGHTHVPRSMRLSDGRTVVNPGSVGLQAYEAHHPLPHKIETGSPHARYAMLEKRAAGWTVEMISVAYDWERMAQMADQRGRADWSSALRFGRV